MEAGAAKGESTQGGTGDARKAQGSRTGCGRGSCTGCLPRRTGSRTGPDVAGRTLGWPGRPGRGAIVMSLRFPVDAGCRLGYSWAPMKPPRQAEWLLMDETGVNRVTTELPNGAAANTEETMIFGPDAEGPGSWLALRITAARLHVRACDGPVPPRRFTTFAAAVAEARAEFAGGEASFDGIRAFAGITVKTASGWKAPYFGRFDL